MNRSNRVAAEGRSAKDPEERRFFISRRGGSVPSRTEVRSAWSTSSSSADASRTCRMIASRETKLDTSAANEGVGDASENPVHTLAAAPRKAARLDVPGASTHPELVNMAVTGTREARRPTLGGSLDRHAPDVLGVCTTRAANIARAAATGIARGECGLDSE